jgi:hypothetical protein
MASFGRSWPQAAPRLHPTWPGNRTSACVQEQTCIPSYDSLPAIALLNPGSMACDHGFSCRRLTGYSLFPPSNLYTAGTARPADTVRSQCSLVMMKIGGVIDEVHQERGRSGYALDTVNFPGVNWTQQKHVWCIPMLTPTGS